MQRSFGVGERAEASDRFLRRDLARKMGTEVKGGVALIWFVSTKAGDTFGHTGQNDPGYTCVLIGCADVKNFEEKEVDECRIAVMTNSIIGPAVFQRIVAAIFYLKKWSVSNDGYHGILTPLVDCEASPDAAWREWKGDWTDGLSIEEDDGVPVVKYGNVPFIRLNVAATASTSFPQGKSIDLVLKVLNLLLRLGWKDGQRDITVWHEATQNKI